MKKRIALLLAMVMLLTAALTGCGNTTAVPEDNDAAYHLKWFAPGTKTQDHDMVFEEISKHTKEKINATIYQQLIPMAEYAETIQRLMFAAEPMDIVFAPNFPNFVSDNVYLELDGLLEEHGKDILGVLPEYVWEAVSVNGKIYGVPPLKDWAVHDVFQYFDGLVEKYNMDFSTVKELKDIEPMLQTIKDNEPGVIPLGVLGRGDGLSVFLPVERIPDSVIGGFMTDDYDTVVNFYETEEFKEYFHLMRDWNNKGFFRSDAVTGRTVTDLINAHKIFLLTSEYVPYFELERHLVEEEGWYTIFDGRLTKPVIRTKGISVTTTCITEVSENPVRAMEFINMMYKDEKLMNMLIYGIEGKHWFPDGEKHISLPEGVPSVSKNDYKNTASHQGNRYLLRIEPNVPGDIWEKYQEFTDTAEVSPALGFNFDKANVMNEITALNNVYQEYIPSLMVGASDPAVTLPEALEKFKVAGSEAVIAEIQRQYDEWKAIQ